MTSHDSRLFILGAGFSKTAGHPLLAEFADAVTELATDPSTRLEEEERRRFTNVLDYRHEMQQLLAYLNLDINNLEHLFSLLDMASSLDTEDASRASVLRNDLVFVLVKTLELTRKRSEQLEDQRMQLMESGELTALRALRKEDFFLRDYVRFAELVRAHDSFITFNYDTVLEDALLTFESAPDYCFAGAGQPYGQTNKAIPVLKLHGSVNFVEGRTGEVRAIDHELLAEPTKVFYENGSPLVIPPTWNKGTLQGPIREIWSCAAELISNSSRIAFVGYSLPETDLSFRYLLANSLIRNKHLRWIRVLDPSHETIGRYKRFVSDILQKQQRFVPRLEPFDERVDFLFNV